MPEKLQKVDHAALKTNQAFIITLSILAFVLDQPWLIVLVMLVMGAGTVLKRPGFGFLYQFVLKPRRWVRPDVLADNPEPHRFAQGFGAVVLAAGSIALLGGVVVPGWALVWLVIALAALNLFGGFCVGCAVYYWLSKINIPGFDKNPPAGTFPGMRPKAGL